MTHGIRAQDQMLGLAAAANVAFWGFLADRFLGGRSWIGVAGAVAGMARASSGRAGPIVELINLPGNITAQVITAGPVCCPACAIGLACEKKSKPEIKPEE